MPAKVYTATVLGLEAVAIEVEADVSNGLPATVVVGLPDTAVQESRERIKSAIKNSDLNYPFSRVSVNLAPADVPKVGTHFDLPIALAILLACGQTQFNPSGKLFVGELALNGAIRPIPGVLAIALCAKACGMEEIYVPEKNVFEASLISGIKVFAVSSLKALILHLAGVAVLKLQPAVSLKNLVFQHTALIDMQDIAGQELAKRALEIASAGSHNIALYGPPGSGKTLLARALSGILPALSIDEILGLTKIYSIAGKLAGPVMNRRPVRHPHHTSSNVALVGGGSNPQPGEITLAHRGVLFLDEFPEFPRNVLEALRQPLEDGVVTVSRAKNTFTFPAKFMLVAAQNPCPCGFLGDLQKSCVCAPGQIAKYQKKVSGPLLDRIDLHVEVPRLAYEKIMKDKSGQASAEIRTRVEAARSLQHQRFECSKTNSEMNVVEVRAFCKLNPTSSELLKTAMKQYSLSGRSVHRVLKVARTIADLVASEHILTEHLAEALQYRVRHE